MGADIPQVGQRMQPTGKELRIDVVCRGNSALQIGGQGFVQHRNRSERKKLGRHPYRQMRFRGVLAPKMRGECFPRAALLALQFFHETRMVEARREASRFGIMNTDETGRIVEFEEKPEHPKSNLASMGIYIFNWKLLRKTLLADMKNADSSRVFTGTG